MHRKNSRLVRKGISLVIVAASAIAIGLIHHVFVVDKPHSSSPPSIASEPTVASPFATVGAQLEEVISATRPVLSPEIESLSGTGNYQLAKNALLERALQSVASADNNSLALHLSELGELALLQGDLGMAEVYLAEALELYEALGEELQLAGVHLQMGRLHLYGRQRARKASDSYDQLLISRWKISQGRFHESEAALHRVVKTNLDLNRYGAAASAYETLFRGYSGEHNIEQAQNSGIEAIKLHAASGNLHAANRLHDLLLQNGLSQQASEQLGQEMQQHYREYESSVKAIGAARDYAQLYNQLSSRGDVLQAWRFRQQAEQSLAGVSKRAQYRRQPDVLVELYRSNFSMDDALLSLQKANAVYSRYGLSDGLKRSRQLREQIY